MYYAEDTGVFDGLKPSESICWKLFLNDLFCSTSPGDVENSVLARKKCQLVKKLVRNIKWQIVVLRSVHVAELQNSLSPSFYFVLTKVKPVSHCVKSLLSI